MIGLGARSFTAQIFFLFAFGYGYLRFVPTHRQHPHREVEAGYEHLGFDALDQSQHRFDGLGGTGQIAGTRLQVSQHRAGHATRR